MTVVENDSGAGGIQYIFTPKWTYWEDLLISCKTTWCRAIKNRAFSVFKVTFHTLKPPKFFWKKNSLKNLKLEEQLLVKWLSILIFCIKVYLVKIGLIFDGSASSCLTRYQHILSVCSFRCKNALNSTCTTMIFHNRHHTNLGADFFSLPCRQWTSSEHSNMHKMKEDKAKAVIARGRPGA